MNTSLSPYTKNYRVKVREFPRFTDLRNMLGLLYYIQGEYRPALEQFDRALSINPLYEEAAVNRAFSLEALGRKEKAVKSLKELIRRKRKVTHWVFLAISILSFHSGDILSALKNARIAYSMSPSNIYALLISVVCLHAAGSGKEAAALLKTAQKKYSAMMRSLGPVCRPKEDPLFISIDDLYGKYLRNPFIGDLFVRISEELEKSNKDKKSFEMMRGIAGAGLASSRLLYFAALAALRKGLKKNAEDLCRKAYEQDRHNAYPAIQLFLLYGEKKQWVRAEKILKAALKENPDYADLHNYLGMFYGDMGRRSLSLKEFAAAVKINPYYMDALYNLAQAFEDAGEMTRSFGIYMKISSIRRISDSMLEKMKDICSGMPPSARSVLKRKMTALLKKKPQGADGLKKVYRSLFSASPA
jgi:tetratricopeptide (TPR) repeat protein